MSKTGSHEPFGDIQHKLWQRKSRESNWQFDSWPLKVKNQPDLNACRWNATHRWKTLDKNYNFALDLVLIKGLSKELYSRKVVGVQTVVVSGLLLGSLDTKSHSDVGAARRHIEYYMGEGGGFPWTQAVVSLVSLELRMVCPSIKGVPKIVLTNLLVGLM
jgi:hypothetical protein